MRNSDRSAAAICGPSVSRPKANISRSSVRSGAAISGASVFKPKAKIGVDANIFVSNASTQRDATVLLKKVFSSGPKSNIDPAQLMT
jgi:hypothetical protein